ncbi:MAG: hypothetical protein C7M88_02835 [Candidatus Arcticimaribacter sp.]|nr:MAG: hypothetical protein C7M88_02835 [Candidatus Arcticimaribacter sp.]
MYKKILFFISFLLYLSCIGTDVTDDYVDPTLRITSPQIISIKVGQKFQFTAKYFDTSGTQIENPNLIWTVSPPDALTIDDSGFATATSDGDATIQVSVVTALGNTISAETSFTISKAVTVITETTTTTTDTGTTTTVSNTNTSTTSSNTSTLTDTGSTTSTSTTGTGTTTTDPDSTTNTSTTTEVEEPVVTETTTTTTDTETTTTVSNTNTSTTGSNTSTLTDTGSTTSTSTTGTGTTTTDPDSTTNTSTTTVDNDVVVTAPQSYQGTIQTTSSYKLTGSYEYGLNDAGQLVLDIAGDYEASTALPGLYVYLSNNPNSTSGSYEIAEVTVFNGAHSYTLPSSIDISDYKYILYWCKPFNVKVGDSTIF